MAVDDTKQPQEALDDKPFDAIFGEPPSGKAPAPPASTAAAAPSQRQEVTEIVEELTRETTDVDPKDAMLRALTVYRAIVRHAKAGGMVKFVDKDGSDKTLRVRVKG